MKNTTLLGFCVGIGGILFGNLIEGGHLGSLVQFGAALIVILGTLGAVLVASQKKDLNLAVVMFKRAFTNEDKTFSFKLFNEIVECARVARKDSIIAIEPRIKNIPDPFVQTVLKSILDQTDAAALREAFETQIEMEEREYNAAAKVWSDAGGFAPTIGIIGAVLGLIHVMGSLTDTSKLGAGIATAFVATIYGVGFANLIFLPISAKIKKKIEYQIKQKEMILEGALGILMGYSPALIETKMRPFLEKVD